MGHNFKAMQYILRRINIVILTMLAFAPAFLLAQDYELKEVSCRVWDGSLVCGENAIPNLQGRNKSDQNQSLDLPKIKENSHKNSEGNSDKQSKKLEQDNSKDISSTASTGDSIQSPSSNQASANENVEKVKEDLESNKSEQISNSLETKKSLDIIETAETNSNKIKNELVTAKNGVQKLFSHQEPSPTNAKLPSFGQVIQSILLTFIAIIIISFTYKQVYKGDDYKIKFNIFLSVVVLITTMIITTIRFNLNISIGLMGILSVIRFRMKLKDFRDAGFILWGIGTGVAIATDHYYIAFGYIIMVSTFFIIMSKKLQNEHATTLIVRSKNLNQAKFETQLDSLCSEFKNLIVENKGTYTEYIYNIKCKRLNKLKEKIVDKFDVDFIKLV